jgi:hypothetical protein
VRIRKQNLEEGISRVEQAKKFFDVSPPKFTPSKKIISTSPKFHPSSSLCPFFSLFFSFSDWREE